MENACRLKEISKVVDRINNPNHGKKVMELTVVTNENVHCMYRPDEAFVRVHGDSVEVGFHYYDKEQENTDFLNLFNISEITALYVNYFYEFKGKKYDKDYDRIY